MSNEPDLVPDDMNTEAWVHQWGNVTFDPLTMEITYPSGRKAHFAAYAKKKHPVGVTPPPDSTPRDQMRYQHVWRPTTVRKGISVLADGNEAKRAIRDLAFDHMMKERVLVVLRFVLGVVIGLFILGVCAVILRWPG